MKIEDLPLRYREQVLAKLGGEPAREKARPVEHAPAGDVVVEFDHYELRVVFPMRSWSLNDEYRSHWSVQAAHTKAVREYLAWSLAGQRLPAYVEQVEIEATSWGIRVDPGSDIPTVKAAVDALVGLGVLTDDRGEFVSRLILNAPIPDGEPRLEIRIRPHATQYRGDNGQDSAEKVGTGSDSAVGFP